MPRIIYSHEENCAFLISCVKHANFGKPNFVLVAGECGMKDRNAAASRYSRLKANVASKQSSPTNDSTPPHRSQAELAKSAESKRMQIEGPLTNPTVDDDDEDIKLEPKPFTPTAIKREPGQSRRNSIFTPTFHQSVVDLTAEDSENMTDVKPVKTLFPKVPRSTSSGQFNFPDAVMMQHGSPHFIKQERPNNTAGLTSMNGTERFVHPSASTHLSPAGRKARSIKHEPEPDFDTDEELHQRRLKRRRSSAARKALVRESSPDCIEIED